MTWGSRSQLASSYASAITSDCAQTVRERSLRCVGLCVYVRDRVRERESEEDMIMVQGMIGLNIFVMISTQTQPSIV